MSDLTRFWPSWLDDDLREALERVYADPARGYHDRRHLSEVLARIEELTEDGDPLRERVLLAAWFHDAVYAARADDEERSARLAETELGDAPVAAEVARLVRLTRDHRPAEDDRAGQLLCDADLSILAADSERYAEYVRGVRSEYAHVDDVDFARERAAVLEALLAAPSLFHSTDARQRWETAARANVERELRSLRSG